MREDERGRGGRVAPLGVSRASAEAGGGRRVAGARRARAPASWREVGGDWRWPVGWAEPCKAQVASFSLFFDFVSIFYLTATV